jgi:EAL domain-containing protein (putative c-di-GMP-specific phosphodiesterase class I)
VNRARVEDAAVSDGDILHFADFEFQLARSEVTESHVTPTTVVDKGAKGTREFREMLREEQVTIAFQPIVLLSRGTIAAYEALGRGRHPELPDSPTALFDIAQSVGKEAELSRLFRKKAVELAAPRSDLPTLFLNTYPTELVRPGMLESLEELRRAAPHLDLALEIHESMLSRPAAIAELRRLLLERNIALAYDDFGAGQSRLLELAEAPPHYLKFDQRFISRLDRAPLARRRLLQSLLSVAQDQLVKTVAEGIETAAEARACIEIGFTHGQGFYMGRPRPIDEI